MKNSIEEAIERLEYIDRTYSCNNYYCVWDLKCIETLLSEYKRVLEENDCLKNHVHYKYCIACGKKFRTKRSDTKYCAYCSKSVTNKIYFANLTEEKKGKRRQQSKLAMRKLREKNK